MLKINKDYFLKSDKYNVILMQTLINKNTGKPYSVTVAFTRDIKTSLLYYIDISIREKLETDIEIRDLILEYDRLRNEVKDLFHNINLKP